MKNGKQSEFIHFKVNLSVTLFELIHDNHTDLTSSMDQLVCFCAFEQRKREKTGAMPPIKPSKKIIGDFFKMLV